jgi:hypothetical protein
MACPPETRRQDGAGQLWGGAIHTFQEVMMGVQQ